MFTANFDGGCYPKNPGGYASYGAVIAKDSQIIWQGSGLIIPETETSNNLAEYGGYIAILLELAKRNLREELVTIRGDAQLVINQMKGSWKIAKGLYRPLALEARRLTKGFPNVRLQWIPREENALADSLARKVLFPVGSICTRCISHNGHLCSCSCHAES